MKASSKQKTRGGQDSGDGQPGQSPQLPMAFVSGVMHDPRGIVNVLKRSGVNPPCSPGAALAKAPNNHPSKPSIRFDHAATAYLSLVQNLQHQNRSTIQTDTLAASTSQIDETRSHFAGPDPAETIEAQTVRTRRMFPSDILLVSCLKLVTDKCHADLSKVRVAIELEDA